MPAHTSSKLTPLAKALKIRNAFRSSITLTGLGLTLSMGMAAQVQAQEWNLNIPAQPLDQALQAFSEQVNIQVLYNPSDVQQLRSTALNGRYDLQQSLHTLFQGTGVHYQLSGNTLTLQPATSGDALELSSVTISGKAPGSITEGTHSYTTGSSSSSTRLNLSPIETPQSISVITRQIIEDRKLEDVTQVMEATTGVTVKHRSYGADGPYIYARGARVNNYMIDGVPTGSRLSNFFQDTAMYDRIEVVRGATGLMNGIGNPSATVNMIRKKPTFTPQASVSLEAGSWDRYGSTLDVSGPLTEDERVRGRLVASAKTQHSWIDGYEQENFVLYGVSEFDLSDSTLLTAGFSHQAPKTNNPLFAGTLLVYNNGQKTGFGRSDSKTIDWTHYDHKIDNAFVSLEHTFDTGWSAKAELGYSVYNYDGQLASVLGNVNPQTGAGAYVQPVAPWIARQEQKSLDAYVTGPFSFLGREHELIAGITLGDTDESSPNYGSTLVPGSRYNGAIANLFTWDGSAPNPEYVTKYGKSKGNETQKAAYLSSRLNLTDSTKLILGTRVTDWEAKTKSFTYAGSSSQTKRQETGIFVPYAGLIQNLNDNWAVYTSYTKIFQPQGSWVKDENNSSLAPEEGTSYEIGIKATTDDGRLNSNLTIFKTEHDNLAVSTVGNFYAAYNGTKSEGVDFEVSGEIAENWNFVSGYAYTVSTDRNDQRFNTFIPRHSFKSFTTYRLPGALDKMTIGAGLNWQSKTGDNLSIYTQKSYTLINLMGKYEFTDNLTGSLNVNNLLDKKYVAGSSGGAQYGYFGEPRNIVTSLKYNF